MFQLNKLPKLTSKKKRVGRGGSRGGTSGKGHKGQKSRSGGSIKPSFEGGQMPISRRLPKRGFKNTRFQSEHIVVSLQQLNDKFDDGVEVTRQELMEKGFLSKKKNKYIAVKILANGKLDKKLIIHADACSKGAIEAIKQSGSELRLKEGE